MPVATRNQTKRNNEQVNAEVPNPYLDKCTTLKATVHALHELYTTPNKQEWRNEVYEKIYQFIHRDMEPSFNEIDDMLFINRILLDNELADEYERFIYKCPIKFLVTFVNSEQALYDLGYICEMGLIVTYLYLSMFVDETKVYEWAARYNQPIVDDITLLKDLPLFDKCKEVMRQNVRK